MKKGCRGCNNWWDADLCGLTDLAFMIGGGVLLDILGNGWPSDVIKQGAQHGIVTLVPKHIMRLAQNIVVL